MFHIAKEDEIKKGKTTDIYFQHTQEILKKKGIKKRVKAEFIVKMFPENWSWGVLAGIEECVKLLENFNVTVHAMREGTIFATNEPVMVIEGEYTEFGVYETPILGLICQASGIATRAARCRKAAGDKTLLSFGARRIHPVISPMVERNAYIGGCDGVSCVKGAELLGIKPMGTMPHALILIIGNSADAAHSFHEIIDSEVKRIVLVDTLEDEKFESLKAAEALGKNLYGVRLDTPFSRRGNFLELLQEVRWELDLRGYKWVKIFVSGGINEKRILELNEVVDGYGVGTAVSGAPILDFAMDIVEIEGKPIAKRGKMSGGKSVLRCSNCYKKIIIPQKEKPPKSCECGGNFENLLKPLIIEGKLARKLERPQEIRQYVLEQLKFYDLQ